MKRKQISQAEARRAIKRVAELENRDEVRMRRWGSEYPGGVHLTTITPDSSTSASLKTAQLLDHRLVCKVDSDGRMRVYAVRS